LSAALNGGITEKTYIGAILVEMAHSASLVHDDIIDEAFMRRGQLSVNAIWRSRTAVLVGDYILAQALRITAKNNASELLSTLIESFEKLCEGELIQLEHASKLDMTEQAYFDVIYRKTASLLGSAAAIGAQSTDAPKESVSRMKRLGECIGMAFQIKDDLLDYEPSAKTGKSSGNDLKERKITLPLLYLLNQSPEKERKKLIGQISTVRDNEKNVTHIQKKVIESGAVGYAEQVMRDYEQQALNILREYPKSPIRESLELYCHFILKRKK
ncbi:MAG: polyprenyl synthetase family protein, partial [Rikenellaceae bacterium]|nr:polyprenyl synthetase family protein [Rikenellaceae bacterium]